MNKITAKQEAFALSLLNKHFGDNARFIAQHKRNIERLGFKFPQSGMTKDEASRLISKLAG